MYARADFTEPRSANARRSMVAGATSVDSDRPIQLPCQSDLSSSPISNDAGSLSATLPDLSHTRTFHEQRCVDVSAGPAYSTWSCRSDSTRPLSQMPSTMIWYAVWNWSRWSDWSCQLNRGL